MSFVGTPLGQGRRLDHSSFLGKPPSSGSQPPTSYSYGAPALGSRSPPKSPAADQQNTDENDSALSRFARAKQQQAATSRDFSDRPGGPKIISSPPKPERWSVKDTSVNIATAFTQAASTTFTDMSTSAYNHNNAWASSSRTATQVPRSTSVEYEAAAPQAVNRRLPAPPDKFNRPQPTATRKPLSKTASLRVIPDSEGEEDHSATAHGKSTFEQGLSIAKTALTNAAYYVRQRSREPEDLSVHHPSVNGSMNGNESSYDYAAEEQAFQAQKRSAALKRNRISVDNKAYKPSQDSEDESEWSDDGKTKRRRRKFKKGPVGGPLSTLPVVTAEKRRRRKSLGSKGNPLDPDEDDSGSDGNTQADTSTISNFLPDSLQTSHLPPSRPPQDLSQNDPDDSMLSAEQGLQSIPEVEEEDLPNDTFATARQVSTQPQRRIGSTRPRSRSRSRTPGPHSQISRFSIGGLLGSIVHLAAKLVLWMFSGVLSLLSTVTFLFGQVFGKTFDLIWLRPAGWGSGLLAKYLIPTVVLVCASYVLRGAPLGSYIPSLSFPTSRPPRYHAPDLPPADLAELTARLLRMENTVSGLSRDAEKTEDGIKSFYELQSRLASLEGKFVSENRKVQDADAKARDVFSRSISGVKQEVEVLQSQLMAQSRQMEKDREQKTGAGASTSDDEARSRLKALEERFGGFEGGVKDALDQLAKKAQTPSPSSSTAWWNKLASNIKTADGQDVTLLISQLVNSAVLTLSKDTIAKPDFALHSAGGRVIPSLTSPTLEVRPKGFRRQLYNLFSGTGYALGRAPVTALHHELHNGHCWPFAGKEGQLGVLLAAPAVVVEEVTIDHVAGDVAFDVRSAPKEMEVWGMVDGRENVERVKVWRESGGAATYDTNIVYPPTLPKLPEYIRLANFTYDIHAPNHVQTFAVDPQVRALDVDFGIVVLRVLSNWGMDAFTCLYRFRVHGKRVGGGLVPMGDGFVSSSGEGGVDVDVENQVTRPETAPEVEL